jgi:hypothetical protein
MLARLLAGCLPFLSSFLPSFLFNPTLHSPNHSLSLILQKEAGCATNAKGYLGRHHLVLPQHWVGFFFWGLWDFVRKEQQTRACVCARLLLRSGGSSACLSPAQPCPAFTEWLPFPALLCPSCLPARTPFAHLPVDQEPQTTRRERVGPAPGPSSSPGPVPNPRQKSAIPRERNMPLIDCDVSVKIKSTRLR